MTDQRKRGQSLGERLLRLRNRYFLLLDLVTLPLVAYLAFALRLDSFNLGRYTETALVLAVAALLAKVPLLWLLGGYRRYWPFASLPELELLVWAALVGEVLSVLGASVALAALGLLRLPRSVPLIDLLLTLAVLAAPRLAVRMLYRASKHTGTAGQRRVLIVGAGEGGNVVVQELQRNPQLGLQPLGFVDDDPAKQGLIIRSVPVMGPIEAIPRLVKKYQIKKVLVAIPTATGVQLRRIVDMCREVGVQALTLPGVFELISGSVEVRRFRPVQVEDLLSREPVTIDLAQVRALLAGQVVLVTGAGGSIGSELCRQIARCEPAALVLFGHGENSIYNVHAELSRDYPALTLHPIIGDTRNAWRVDRVFAHYKPAVVVHTAAHKHVPLMEDNPAEAVTNNVGGTWNLLRTCEEHDVQTFVMISSDKAVNPTSTMGATKRIAEHLVQATAQRTGRRFVAVRFGNVLGSRGSVVPLFQAQIEAGGPITVTDPDVERYFMTIPEAVQLALQAAALGTGGEVFVLDMGKPVKIVDLARDMIRLAGLEAGRDIEIAFTGLRPGEKLYEELFVDNEDYARTRHEKVFVARNGIYHADRSLDERVVRLLQAAEVEDLPALYSHIRALVPECAPTLGGETLGPPSGREAHPATSRSPAAAPGGTEEGADAPAAHLPHTKVPLDDCDEPIK